MTPRNRGLGFTALLILVGCFLVLRPLFEAVLGNAADTVHGYLNGATTAIAGMCTFVVAAILDRRTGLDVFSKRAWTSDLMESQHILFYLPLRLIGVIIFAASFLLL